ncbi:MAG: sulfurtransferase [Bryobacterales bacterium]|nr:sulfurtransferase [Bryobacterales bacterium]
MTHGKHHSPAFLALVDDSKSRVKQICIDELRQMRENGDQFILVDVREESEWQAGHVEGAMHLSKGIIERDIEIAIPDKATTIILYCGGGFRSALAADALQQMGYTAVISLDGGWRAWQIAGLPISE